jgi:hypothetical protein
MAAAKKTSASLHTVQTQPASFTSAAASDNDDDDDEDYHNDNDNDETVELGEAGNPLRDANGTNDDRSTPKRQSALLWFLLVGSIMIATAVILLIVFLSGNNKSSGKTLSRGATNAPTVPSDTPPPPPLEGGNSAVSLELERLASTNGALFERLGTSVSVGGPKGGWIAMVGNGVVHVVDSDSSSKSSLLTSVGGNITFPTQVSQVSLSAEGQRIAVAHSGQLSMYQLVSSNTNKDDEQQQQEQEQEYWSSMMVANNSTIGDWEGTHLSTEKTEIPTSGSISGTGLVAAGGVILHTTKESYVAVQIFEQHDQGVVMAPLAPPMTYSVDESDNSIRVELSYDGDILAILTDGSVKIQQRTTTSEYYYDWVDFGDQSQLPAPGGFTTMALSGDATTLALTNNDETMMFAYNSDTDQWERVTTIMVGGGDVSLSYDGDYVVIGNVKNGENGSAALWQRQSTTYQMVDEVQGDTLSEFGMSVAIAKNRQWDLLLVAVGAPMEGKRRDNGSVHVYQMQTSRDD